METETDPKRQSWQAWKETLDEALRKLASEDIRGTTNTLEGARNIIENALAHKSAKD